MRNSCQWRASRSLVLLAIMVGLLVARPPQSVEAITYAFTKSNYVCFIEEISREDFSITGRYNYYPHPDKSIQLALVLYGPDNAFVTTEDMKTGEHAFRLSLGPRQLGPYRLCAEVVSTDFNPEADPPLYVDFDVDQTHAGESKVKEAETPRAKREEVDGLLVFTFTDTGGETKTVLQPRVVIEDLENGLHELLLAIGNVEDQTEYLLQREDRMRMTSESTFMRVWVLAAITIVVTSVCILVQFRMLKRTIVKKKLI